MLVGLGMGAFGYAAQSGLYFSALTRIDASLLALLLYVYPVLVMAGAITIGRERASRDGSGRSSSRWSGSRWCSPERPPAGSTARAR